MTTSTGLLIEKLLPESERQGKEKWDETRSLVMQIVREHPNGILDLALAVMERLPSGGSFLDEALSFLPEDEWPDLVERAVAQLEAARAQGDQLPNAAVFVVSCASLQCPRALHLHLERLFVLDDLFSSYSAIYPWRESGQQQLSALQEHFDAADGVQEKGNSFRRSLKDRRFRAWMAMLETRSLPVMERALSLAESLGLSAEEVRAYCLGVGYEVREGALVPLYSPEVWHLSFVEGFFPSGSDFSSDHPTWHLPASGPTHRFGGVCSGSFCQRCVGELHHLLTLDPIPESLGVTGRSSLTLATCLSCLGWEESPLYYRYDMLGNPRPLQGSVERHWPEILLPPLPETRVRLSQALARWRWDNREAFYIRENLYRLGGSPWWLQGAMYPECGDCGRMMNFLAQIDLELPLHATKGIQRGGDCGNYDMDRTIQGFWCDTCQVSAFVRQYRYH